MSPPEDGLSREECARRVTLRLAAAEVVREAVRHERAACVEMAQEMLDEDVRAGRLVEVEPGVYRGVEATDG